jgi:hypothetical protein
MALFYNRYMIKLPRWAEFIRALKLSRWPVVDYEEQVEMERKERIRTLFGK